MTAAATAAPTEDAPGLARELARVTGLLLVLLVGVHVVTLLFRDPGDVDLGFLADRWEHPYWLLADWGLVLVGTVHALLSLWVRLGAPPSERRLAAFALIATLATALFVTASWGMLRLV